MNLIIAVDPGASGGFAMRDAFGELKAWPMPETEKDIVNALQKALSKMRMARADGHEVEAIVEEVGGYVGGTGNPGSAMFKFGRNFGLILGVLYAAEIRIRLVKPQEWQRGLSLGNSKAHASKAAWKNHLKARAQQLFPDLDVTLKTADALLLLEYAENSTVNHK